MPVRGRLLARARGLLPGFRSCSRCRRTRRTSPATRRGSLEPGAGARRAAAGRRPAGVRLLRRLGGVGRAAGRARASSPTTRASGGTCGRTRASARSRSGCPTSRPSLERAGARRAAAGALRAAALGAPHAPPCDRGDYAQNRWAAARFGPQRGADPSRRGSCRCTAGALGGAAGAAAPGRPRVGTLELLESVDPTRARPTSSWRSASPAHRRGPRRGGR